MQNLVSLLILATIAVLSHGQQTYQRLESSYPNGVRWQLIGSVQRKQQTLNHFGNVGQTQYEYKNYQPTAPFGQTLYKKQPVELTIQKNELVGPQYLVPNVVPIEREVPGYQYPIPSYPFPIGHY